MHIFSVFDGNLLLFPCASNGRSSICDIKETNILICKYFIADARKSRNSCKSNHRSSISLSIQLSSLHKIHSSSCVMCMYLSYSANTKIYSLVVSFACMPSNLYYEFRASQRVCEPKCELWMAKSFNVAINYSQIFLLDYIQAKTIKSPKTLMLDRVLHHLLELWDPTNSTRSQ